MQFQVPFSHADPGAGGVRQRFCCGQDMIFPFSILGSGFYSSLCLRVKECRGGYEYLKNWEGRCIMAVTRSRNSAKGREDAQSLVGKIKKETSTSGKKNDKISNSKSVKRLSKSRTKEQSNNGTTNKVDKSKEKLKLKAVDINESVLKSEIFKAATIDSKGKKLPAYKVEQLQRLQHLITMSQVAKPRGPVTGYDYIFQNKNGNKNENENNVDHNMDSLNLILNKSIKGKISNVTNYDPIRKDYINGKLTKKERKELGEKYDKIRKYQNIIAPKLEDDVLLRQVLSEIVEKNQGLKFWKYYNEKLEAEGYGDCTLLRNEKILQMHGIDLELRENLLRQRDDMKVGGDNDNDNDHNDGVCGQSIDDDGYYKKIDIEKAKDETKLSKMLKMVSNHKKDENEENVFKGLKLEDFTTIRKFDGNGKV